MFQAFLDKMLPSELTYYLPKTIFFLFKFGIV